MAASKYETEIINRRADELEKIGFVFRVSGDGCWYQKGDIKMIPILMMCLIEPEWQKFIKENTNPNQHEAS